MFKSVFAKYVTAFMTIITFGFALLLLIVTSIVRNYSADTKVQLMHNATDATKLYLEESAAVESAESFEIWIREHGEDRVAKFFSAFSESDEDLSFFVTDSNGAVICAVEGVSYAADWISSTPFSADVIEKLTVEGAYEGVDGFSNSQQEVFLSSVCIYADNGELCGMIAVSSSNLRWGHTVEDLSKTVITSALLVLLAAMIAAYFITERTIAPLREMSTAARNFAAGKFDSRVIVRGQDEVAELSEAFNQMADSLQNLENMRNSFIANVSHDLRTPMTTIAGFIDSIRDGVIPPEEQDHYLEVVSIEVHRLSRLVASLLDLSRLQAGDRKFTMKAFDICEMARLILISFEQKIEEKKLKVEFECEEDRMAVLADRDAIYQIFYNICHNAVKFSRPGGTLRIRIVGTKEKKIQVSIYNDGDGIPKEDQPMVFERFYKSDKSRGLDKSGVGLGLFISKTIITAHGEKIWVSSEPGQNCEFFFTLPRASLNNLHAAEDK